MPGITIDSNLNSSGVITGARDMKGAVASLSSAVSQAAKDMNASLSGFVDAVNRTATASGDFASQISKLKSDAQSIKGALGAEEYEKLTSEIDDCGKAMKTLTGEQGKLATAREKAIAQIREKAENDLINAFGKANWDMLPKPVKDSAIKQNEEEIARQVEALGKLEDTDAYKNIQAQIDDTIQRMGELTAQIADVAAQHSEIASAAEEINDSLDGEIQMHRENTDVLEEEAAAHERVRDAAEEANNAYDGITHHTGSTTDAPDPETVPQSQKPADLSGAKNAAKEASTFLDAYMRKWQQMKTLSGMVGNAAATAITPMLHPLQALDRLMGAVVSGAMRLVAALARMAGHAAVTFLKQMASAAQNAAVALAKLAASAVAGALQKIASGARAVATAAKNAVVQLAKMTAVAITSGMKKLGSAAVSAGRGLLNVFKNNKMANGSMKQSLKTILKYAFGVRSMFFLFKRLRTAVADAFGEMAKQSPDVKTAIDGLKVALAGLKASLATAFAPIFTAIAPALTYLINMLTAALNTIGAFMAALTGKGTFKKASGNIGAIGKSAKGSGKAAKELERQLAGFDELTILKGNDSGGGGGGGGGGSGMSFIDSEIPEGIKNFVDQLKELWKNGEYEKIGKLLGKQINKLLNKAYNAVKWSNVQKKWTKAIDAFTGIFNGLVKSIDWPLIGKTFNAGLDTLVQAANYAITHLDLKAAGTAFSAAINGFFANKELFAHVPELINNAIFAGLDFVQAFLDHLHEGDIATAVRTALTTGIKWDAIGEYVWSVIKTAFNKAGNFLNVLFGGEDKSTRIESEILKAHPKLAETSGDSIVAFQPTFEVPDTVWDDLADTLGTGIEKAIGNLTTFIKGLSVSDAVGAVIDWITRLKNGAIGDGTNIGQLFGAGFGKIFEGVETVITKLADDAPVLGAQVAHALTSMIGEAFKGQTIANIFTSMVRGAFNFIDAFLDNFEADSVATEVRSAITGVPWGSIASDAWEIIKKAFGATGSFIDVLLGGSGNNPVMDAHPMMEVMGVEASVWDDIAQRIGQGMKSAISGLSGIISEIPITEVAYSLSDWFLRMREEAIGDGSGIGEALGKAFKLALGAIGPAIGELSREALGLGRDLANAINKVIRIAFAGSGDTSISGMFTNAVKGAFDLVKGFLEGFKPTEAAEAIREQINLVPWGELAQTAWDLFKEAAQSLGSFLTVLFGGESIDESVLEAHPRMAKNRGKTDLSAAGLGDIVSTLSVKILDAIKAAFAAIPWEEWGNKLHDFLVGIKWLDVAKAFWNAIIEAAKGLGTLIVHALFGEETLANAQQRREREQKTEERIKNGETQQVMAENLVGDYTLDLAIQIAGGSVQSGSDVQSAIAEAFDFTGISALWDSFGEEYKTEILSAMTTALSNLGADDSEITSAFNELGLSSADGLAQGYSDEMDAKTNEFESATDKFPDAVRDELDSHSPSRVFEKIGIDAVGGLILGLQTLRDALRGIWDNLPTWAQSLLGNTAAEFKLALSGGGGGGGASDEQTAKSTKATKKDIKETRLNTKELKKNTKKRSEVDVNYEGAGFDTSGDKPKLNVGVNFTPEGEEPSDENTNGGLLGWLQNLLAPGALLEVVALLTGKDPASVTIGDIFDTILNVVGFLTGKDPKSVTIGDLFGAVLQIVGKLTGKDPKTLTLSDLFDTILSVYGKLTGKDPKSSALSAIFDTVLAVVGKLTGKDPKSLSLSGIFNTVLAVLGKLTGRDPKSLLLSNIFDTILSVFASAALGKGQNANSVLNLFNWTKQALADTVGRGKGLTISSILDLFNWSKTVSSGGASKGELAKSAIIDLFSWGKTVSSSGAGRGGLAKSAIIDLFSWGKTVSSSGVSRGKNKKGQKIGAGSILDLFKWTKTVKSSGASRGGLSKSAIVNLFTWSHKVTVSDAALDNKAKAKIKRDVQEAAASGMKSVSVPVQTGGVITSGAFRRFAAGGIISGGASRFLSNVPHYASGTRNAHGTVFVAGEAGPEIMGHINGRTEILNKSQIATAIYAAVVSGMETAVNALGRYIANHMTNCTNSIVRTIGANVGLAGNIDYYAPAIASGGILPYDVSMQIAKSTQALQNTLDANNEDLIQAMVSAMGNAADSIVRAIQTQMRQGNNAVRGTTGTSIEQINRQTLMYGKSPLKGV